MRPTPTQPPRPSATLVSLLVVAVGCTPPTATPAQPAVAGEASRLPGPPPLASDASLSDVAERVVPAVVSVASTRQIDTGPLELPFDDPLFRRFFGPELPFGVPPGPRPEVHGLGSGVLVATDLILTNAHVVERATTLKVIAFDHRELEAEVVGIDRKSDLAVLRLRGKTAGLAPLEFGDSSRLRLADVVLAVGNPFGVGETVTMGIVSAKGRANVGIADYEDFIQTDAAINPGNSGGALVDRQGKLVGIPTAILSRSGGDMGIGFAIPSNMARPIMESLIKHGRVTRGWLGVAIQDLTDELADALGLHGATGVLVSDVSKASPAERAGLKRGDVVLRLDGVAVGSSSELRNRVAEAGAGKTVRLGLSRGGKPLELAVVLGEAPGEPDSLGAGATARDAAGSVMGLEAAPLDEATRTQHTIPAAVAGLVVTAVVPGSPAARAGLRRGDVVIEVDRQPVTTTKQLASAWARAKGPVAVLVWRQGFTSYLIVRR